MSDDETQPGSGSRWEPADGEASDGQTPAVLPPPVPPQAYDPAPDAAPTGRHGGRLLLAGAAAGVALLAGTGGFALGHATAGHDDQGRIGLVGSDDADGYGPAGFPGQDGDGRGVPPQGLPPQGGLPQQGDPGSDDGSDDGTDDGTGGSHT